MDDKALKVMSNLGLDYTSITSTKNLERSMSQTAAGESFISMMERLCYTQGTLNDMMHASSYSMRENEWAIGELAKQYKSFKATTQELTVALDILKTVANIDTDATVFAQMDSDANTLTLTTLELIEAVKMLQSIVSLFTTAKGLISLLPAWGQVAAVITSVASAIGLYTYNIKQADIQTINDINTKQAEIEEVNKLIDRYGALQGQVNKNNDVKQELLDIQKQLAAIYPGYADSIDDERNSLINNIPLLREIVSLKQQELDLVRQEAVEKAKRELPELIEQQWELDERIRVNKERLDSGDTKETKLLYGYGVDRDSSELVIDKRADIIKETQQLLLERDNVHREIAIREQLVKQAQGMSVYDERDALQAEYGKRLRSQTPPITDNPPPQSIEQDKITINEALQSKLRILEHKKRMDQISVEEEIASLNQTKALYVKNANEHMDIDERIYDARKRLMNETLQNSINWIDEQKSLGKLSAEEEIAAWERVKNKQSDNIEAVKQATFNLYKLRDKVITESFTREDNSIKHLTKLGVLSVDEQIKKYRELYEVKASSIAEEQSRVENLFDLYKKLISDQQRTIKGAYNNRIKQIDEEANKKKSAQQDIIAGIEKELELLNRQERKYDHDKKMADLNDQLAYWQVRTSEDARKKVAELSKQIDETEHDREIELKKQGLEDKKKILQDEIKSIDETANKEKDKWEKSYKKIEVVFDEHSTDMIALASTMSKEMFEEFKNNYLIPLENALRNADYDSIGGIVDGIDDFAKDAYDKTYNTKNAQIKRLAEQILDYKYQYEYGGDKSAEQRAKSYYDELSQLSPGIADMLHQSDYMTAKKYLESLSQRSSGSKALSYKAAYIKPEELVFPPDLSDKLENQIQVLYTRPTPSQTSSSVTDRRIIQNFHAPLFNSERTIFEDDTDEISFARELKRAIDSTV